jgi:hypothetical protein
VESAADTLRIADMHNLETLKRSSLDFITDNAEEVSETEGYMHLSSELLSELFVASGKKVKQLEQEVGGEIMRRRKSHSFPSTSF